jgi:hypothetical protein
MKIKEKPAKIVLVMDQEEYDRLYRVVNTAFYQSDALSETERDAEIILEVLGYE